MTASRARTRRQTARQIGLIAAVLVVAAGADAAQAAQESSSGRGESPQAASSAATPAGPEGPAPRCDAAHEGIVACFANVLCLCRFHPGDAARKLPDRFAWDCGITRPQCALPPADLTPRDPYATPPVIVDVDHPHTDVTEDIEDNREEATEDDGTPPPS